MTHRIAITALIVVGLLAGCGSDDNYITQTELERQVADQVGEEFAASASEFKRAYRVGGAARCRDLGDDRYSCTVAAIHKDDDALNEDVVYDVEVRPDGSWVGEPVN